MRRYGIRDDQWERIRDLLPGQEGHVGVTAADNRLFVESGFAVTRYRHAVARSARKHFGNLEETCHFNTSAQTWAKSGVWEKVLSLQLSADADNEICDESTDTIVHAHQHSAGAQKKPARTRRSADHAGG